MGLSFRAPSQVFLVGFTYVVNEIVVGLHCNEQLQRLKRWDCFTSFLGDGKISPTSNTAERALRIIDLGGKIVGLRRISP